MSNRRAVKKSIQFSGWQAVAAVLLLIALLLFRVITIGDGSSKPALIEKIVRELNSEYYSQDVAAMQAAVARGDFDGVTELTAALSGQRYNFESISSSYPLFKFTSNKKVVVRVRYSLAGASGPGSSGTRYYLFDYGALSDNWQYLRDSNMLIYYLNFI